VIGIFMSNLLQKASLNLKLRFYLDFRRKCCIFVSVSVSPQSIFERHTFTSRRILFRSTGTPDQILAEPLECYSADTYL